MPHPAERPPHPSTRPLRPALRLLALLLLTVLLASCATGVVPGTSPGPYEGATSDSCDATRGAEALYWDFMNGIIRVDYPETYRFIPYPQTSVFIHPSQPLYSFSYPPGWTVDTLFDAGSNLAGANVVRPDGQVVWRRLSYVLSGNFAAADIVDGEVQQIRSILGIAGPNDTVCFLNAPDNSRAALLVRADGFTANITAQVFVNPFLGGFVSNIFVQVAIAPTAEYDARAVDTFFPLSGQMNLGGGSGDPQCSDGIDNDGDGKTDFPADDGCTSADDPSE